MTCDFTLVSQAADAANTWEPFGFPVKSAVELIVMIMIVLGFAGKGYKLTAWFCKNPPVTKTSGSLEETTDYSEPWTEAMDVAYRNLHRGRAVYEPEAGRLHCPGLMVEFVSGTDAVKRLLGVPKIEPNGGTAWQGTDLQKLVGEKEYDALCQAAVQVRDLAVERDRNEANMQAAEDMAKAAHAGDYEYPRVYEAGDGTANPRQLSGGLGRANRLPVKVPQGRPPKGA